VNAHALAQRRHLLVASATLQRVRFAHEVSALRVAWRPPPWTLPLLAFAATTAALMLLVRRRSRPSIDRATAWPWIARAFTLWRAARVFARWWSSTA
jgi:hypothetical protein